MRVPGRLRVVDEDPLTVLDGAHNPSGMAALTTALPDVVGEREFVAVVSVLDDRDTAGMLKALIGKCGAMVLTASRNPRALPPATLASLAEQLGGPPTRWCAIRTPRFAAHGSWPGPTAPCSRRARSSSWPTSSARPRAEGVGAVNDERGPSMLAMMALVAVVVALVILVFFALGYAFGRASCRPPRVRFLPHSSFGVFGITNDGLNQAVSVLILVLIVIWAALVFWTYADARRRIDDPMLVGCATAASLFPFVGTIVYVIVRPPEFLDDVRLRELEMTAAEARLANLDYQLCPHCDYEVKGDPALPELHAQAQGLLLLLREADRARLEAVPVLRGGDRRQHAVLTRRRRRSATTDQPTVAHDADLEHSA